MEDEANWGFATAISISKGFRLKLLLIIGHENDLNYYKVSKKNLLESQLICMMITMQIAKSLLDILDSNEYIQTNTL